MAILKRIKPPPPLPPPQPKPEPPKPVIKPEPPKPSVAAIHPKVVEHRQLGVQNRDAVERIAATRPPEPTPPVTAPPKQQNPTVQAAVFRPQGQPPTVAPPATPAVPEQQRQDALARAFFNQPPANVTVDSLLQRTPPIQGPGLTSTGQPTPPITPVLSPADDAQAKQAAAQVQQTLDANPNPVVPAPGQSLPTTAGEVAARQLRDITATQSPEVAAQTVRYAQPSVDRITADLGGMPVLTARGRELPNPHFDNVVNDLAAVSARVATATNGAQVVDRIAQSVVNNINPERLGNFDNALGATVENGSGSELAAAVVHNLNGADRTEQANDVLGSVAQSIENLHERTTEAATTVAKHQGVLSTLIQRWQPQMSEQQLRDAIAGYKRDNPEYEQAMSQMSVAAHSLVSAISNFGNAENPDTAVSRFPGLSNASDVDGAILDFAQDKETNAVLAQSPGMTEAVASELEKGENNGGQPNFFDQVVGIAGRIDDGGFLTETVFNASVNVTINNSIDAARSGDMTETNRQMTKLENAAGRLGFDNPQFRALTEQYRTIAGLPQLPAGADPSLPENARIVERLQTELRTLSQRVNDYQATKPEVFSDNSALSNKFKNFGLGLGVIGTTAGWTQFGKDPSDLNLAGSLIDSAGLVNDVAQRDLVTSLVTRTESGATAYGSVLGALGKGIGVASLLFDSVSIIRDFSEGKVVEGSTGIASAVGGSIMMLSGAAATGIGLAVVGAAVLTQAVYNQYQFQDQYEQGGISFLRGAGVNLETAVELSNDDTHARSTAPVFTELARQRGVDPHAYFNYLASLPPDRARELVHTAQRVQPDQRGAIPVNRPNTGRGPGPNVNDVNDLAAWMKKNGYNAPGL